MKTLITCILSILSYTIYCQQGIQSDTTFVDTRDSKVYKIKKIGNQIWMTENLNYATNGSSCFDKQNTNCDKYGRLYKWEVAKAVCPNGWHLPSIGEFKQLKRNYKNKVAFERLTEGDFNGLSGGDEGSFWTSSKFCQNIITECFNIYYCALMSNLPGSKRKGQVWFPICDINGDYTMFVRCIKN